MSIFKGAGVAIVTPMKENEEVNYEKLQELGLGNRIMEEQNIFLPCPEREKRELLKQIRSFLTAEPKILSSANCCGLGGCAALKEPELAGQMAKSAGSIQLSLIHI